MNLFFNREFSSGYFSFNLSPRLLVLFLEPNCMKLILVFNSPHTSFKNLSDIFCLISAASVLLLYLFLSRRPLTDHHNHRHNHHRYVRLTNNLETDRKVDSTTELRGRHALERRSLLDSLDYNSEEDDSGEKNSSSPEKDGNKSSTTVSAVGSDDDEGEKKEAKTTSKVVLENVGKGQSRSSIESKAGEDTVILMMTDDVQDGTNDSSNNTHPRFSGADIPEVAVILCVEKATQAFPEDGK